MAIHDVDNSPNREAPMPNTHDTSFVSGAPIINQPRPANGTVSIQPVTDATTQQGFIQTKNAQILTNDGSTNRLQITPTRMLVSQAGVDVTTADPTQPGQVIFDSDNDVFKIVQSGTTSLTYGSGDTVNHVTVNHNLGFIPACQVYLTNSPLGGEFYFPLPSSTYYARNGGFIVFNAYNYFTVDSTTLKIYLATGTASAAYAGSWNFKYYILQETAS